MNEGPAISVKDARFSYAAQSSAVLALGGVSLSIAVGEFVAIIGPNGSGKSTLLKSMAGLLALDSGEVRIGDARADELDSRQRARRVALVPQSLEVLSGYSVEDFVMMGRYAHLSGWRLFGRHDRDVARACLERVDGLQFASRGMTQMSGGERQRALIARALAQEAGTILLDEPTSALDLKHQLRVYRLIHELQQDAAVRRTVVVVTHDLNLASQFAQRLLLMQNGKIVSEGTPEQVLRPEILNRVYETELAFGSFEQTVSGTRRPWVLPWAK